MIDIRHLTPELRKKLKAPLGMLFQGSFEEIMKMIRALVEKEKPPKIVTVGDRISQDLADNNILPNVLIVDNKVMRKEIPPISATADKVKNVKNPAGTITDEAWFAIERAMNDLKRTKIVVDGEEDLLALVSILVAPENSFIFYGQPKKGVVTVKVTSDIKQKIRKIVDEMDYSKSDNLCEKKTA